MAHLKIEDDFFGNFNAEAEEDKSERFDTMVHHDMRSLENKFHNIGFQEAYDEANTDSKLEEGFVDGFQELIDVAIKIGGSLGEVASNSILVESTNNDHSVAGKKHNNSEDAVTTKSYESRKEVFHETRKDIVSFLSAQKDNDFNEEGNAEIYFKNLESKISKMTKNENN